ncbi:MAG: tetratricopeptide repeat protein [Rhodospirillaceae bacterium]|nr:tetratricopeptide repeat protein [Rhodospirillaceae bacterium]
MSEQSDPPSTPSSPFYKWVFIAIAASFVVLFGVSMQPSDPPPEATKETTPPPKPVKAAEKPVEKAPETEATEEVAQVEASKAAPVVPGSLSGNYLAGRHAQTNRHMADAARFLGKAIEMEPSKGVVDLPRRVFLLTLAEGDVKKAIAMAAGILKDNAKATIAGLVIAVDDIVQARYPDALKAIEKLPKGGLNVYMAPLLDAWTGVATAEKTEDAIARLGALKKDGTEALYQLHKGIINDIAGNAEQAEKDYQAAITAQGGPSLRLIELLGNLYERSGQSELARELYTEHQKTSPRSSHSRLGLRRVAAGTVPKPIVANAFDGAAEAFFGIATSLSQQNAKETALVFGRLALYLRPDFPVMQMLLGNILQDDGQYEDANKMYAAVSLKSPYSWASRLNLSENLDDMGQVKEAEEYLRAMAAEEPELATPLIRLGDLLRGHEEFKRAVGVYNQALERIGEPKPHHWSLLYALGIVLERSDRWDEAEAKFLQVMEFEPDQPMLLNYLGYSWIDKGLHLDRATEMIKKAVKLRPTDGYIADSLGWAYYRLGNFEESAKEMERAVSLRPEDPVINDHLGDAYWRVGRFNEARFQWQHVLTLDPDDDVAGQVRDKLKDGLKPADTADNKAD